MMRSKIQNSKSLTPFVTSHGPQYDPKWSENHLKRQMSQLNDCVGLRMRIGEFLWMDSRFWCQNFDILIFEGVR